MARVELTCLGGHDGIVSGLLNAFEVARGPLEVARTADAELLLPG